MTFPRSLRDGSDPDYAPLLQWAGDVPWWRASKKYRELGYTPANVKLTGRKGDGLDRQRADECRQHTIKMLDSFDPLAKVTPKTWDRLIDRWMKDEFSPAQTGGFRRRDEKQRQGQYWLTVLKDDPIADMDYEMMCRLRRSVEAKYQAGYVVKKLDALKSIVRYGIVLKVAGARDITEYLTIQRSYHPGARDSYATPEQIEAITREALRQGLWSIAVGVQLAWVTQLRLIDIRGQYEPVSSGDTGGIAYKAMTGQWYRWRDGLTWDMVDPDLSNIRKAPSKTIRKKSRPKAHPIEGGIAQLVNDLLSEVPLDQRVGPVIVRESTGLPYQSGEWTKAFKKVAKAAGLPPEIRPADIRPGAVTDGEQAGASPQEMQDAAGHSSFAMTSIYARADEKNIKKVFDLRSIRAQRG